MSTLYENWGAFNAWCNDQIRSDFWPWQVFFPSIEHTITSVKVLLVRDEGEAGILTCEIQSTEYDSEAGYWKPTGTALCSGTLNTLGIPSDAWEFGTWCEIYLGAGALLTAGEKYAIVMKGDPDYSDAYCYWFYNYDEPLYHGGHDCGYKDALDPYWYSWWQQTYPFEEYGGLTIVGGVTLTEFKDLVYSYDDSEIFNDLRVQIPNYNYELSYIDVGGGNWQSVVKWRDLVYISLDSDSLNKYGRRTKVQKYHVMDAVFQEAYCENSKQLYAEPKGKLDITLLGKHIAEGLAAKLSDPFHIVAAALGIDAVCITNGITIEVTPRTLVPIITISLDDTIALQTGNLFVIDADLIDGEHVIG